MGRKVIALWLSSVMMMGFIVILDVSVDFTMTVKGITHYVNTTGSGGAYTSIQDAIDNSSDGDIVFVFTGIYNENLVINKSINLTGETRDTTIIDGDNKWNVVKLTADWINISGFTVKNGSAGLAGILLDNASNCNIINNDVSYSRVGISLNSSSYNNIINNNVYQNSRYGISLTSSPNKNVTNTKNEYGIFLESSPDNNITYNDVVSNIAGLYSRFSANTSIMGNRISLSTVYGIATWGPTTTNHEIIRNNVSQNGLDGIVIKTPVVKIIGNTISQNNERGIAIFEQSQNNTISENNISGNGMEGLLFYSTSNNTVTNNNFTNDGMFIMGELLNQNTHTIPTNNFVNGNPLYYHKDGSGVNLDGDPVGQLIFANFSDVNVKNLHINNADVGIATAYAANITIMNNNVSSNDNYGVVSIFSSDINILNSNISNNGEGIHLFHSSNKSRIINNSILSNEHYGIYISHSSNISVNGNVVTNAGMGICFNDEVDNSTISNNKVLFNEWYGIILYTSSNNNTVTNNIVLSTDWYGVYIYSASDNNTIGGNYISSNNQGGLYLQSSSNNKIINNTVVDNGQGITQYLSTKNLIYHNNIITNINQAIDDSSGGNSWDNGYPLGGNFWSDYLGEDRFSGPSQDIPGNDGIGDTNYSIDSDSLDNYPLMSPVGPFVFLYEGWNLISLPYIQSEINLESILSSINGSYDAVQWYNISDISDQWKHNQISKPSNHNDFQEINHTMGFWIHITEPGGVLFEYLGTQPTQNQTIQLHKGWNMVGYPSLTSYNRTKGMNNLTFNTHVDAIWTYNSATQKYKQLTASDYFKIGKGYYIHTKAECTWAVPL
jgi:parallel beta-helix repeat protein